MKATAAVAFELGVQWLDFQTIRTGPVGFDERLSVHCNLAPHGHLGTHPLERAVADKKYGDVSSALSPPGYDSALRGKRSLSAGKFPFANLTVAIFFVASDFSSVQSFGVEERLSTMAQ